MSFNMVMFLSKITGVTPLLVQLFLTIIGIKYVAHYFPKGKIFLQGLVFILLIANIILSVWGIFSESVIAEFQDQVYFGQTENGRANGYGQLYDANRNLIYVGTFRNNQFDGKGRYYKTLETKGELKAYLSYEGEYKNGERFGEGKSYYPELDSKLIQYTGNFRDGEFSGSGTYYHYDEQNRLRATYEGCFAYGKYYGFGIYIWYNPDTGDELNKFMGTYISNARTGWGSYYENKELTYLGYWANDTYNGSGTYFYRNADGAGRKVVGDFSDGYLAKPEDAKIYDWDDNIIENEMPDENILPKETSS